MDKKYAHPHGNSGVIIGNRYRIEEVLGKGGMGVVFSVSDLKTGEAAAVKKLHKRHLENDDLVIRFRREAELAALLRHNGICPVLDTGVDMDGVPFFSMPLLKGRTLAAAIKEADPVDIAWMVGIVDKVLDALAFAHERGVLHRDIKPDNVFICDDATGAREVKLLDFGISKIDGNRTVQEISTCTGAVLGTPHYMSPEQARGAKYVDNRADIFSVGIMLYEALTKKKPFDGRVYNDVIIKLVSEPFVPPTSINPGIPKAVENIIIKAMARHPDDRYSSAEEMKVALDEAARSTGYESDDIASTMVTTIHGGEAREVLKRNPVVHASRPRKLVFATSAIALLVFTVVGLYWLPVRIEAEKYIGAVSSSGATLDVHIPEKIDDSRTATRPALSISVSPHISIVTTTKETTIPQKNRASRRKKNDFSSSVGEPGDELRNIEYNAPPIAGRLGTKVVAHF